MNSQEHIPEVEAFVNCVKCFECIKLIVLVREMVIFEVFHLYY